MTAHRKTITLTEQQNLWIKSQIGDGHYTNDSEYIRELVRRDQARSDSSAALMAEIAAGLASADTDKSLDDIWADAEARYRKPDA